jgi:hypothetical protein
VNELLSQKAYFYVCGDAANMAREVNAVLAQIIAEGRGVTEAKGEDIVKNMRAANQYQVRNISITTPAIRVAPHLFSPQNHASMVQASSFAKHIFANESL